MAKAVKASYGQDYQEAVDYLTALAANHFYKAGILPELTWLKAVSAPPGVGAPAYRLHPSVIQSLAPSVALRAAFGGARNV